MKRLHFNLLYVLHASCDVSKCHALQYLLSLQVPKSIPAWQAAFIEPLACSIHATELGNIQLDDVVVISGCGPLGLGMVAAARLKNPKKLIALDLLGWKVCVWLITILFYLKHTIFV